MQDWALQNKQCHQLLCSNDVCFTVSSPTVRKTLCVLHILHLHSVNSELIYQLDAIEYLFVYYQLDMFRAYTPIFRGNGCYNLFTYTAYGVLGVVRCWSWGVCVLVACCSATRHQHTHCSRPTPNYTKDTICCICKEIIAPEDGGVSPKHVELIAHK